MSDEIECPKCHSEMIEGKLLQLTNFIDVQRNIWTENKSKEDYDSSGLDPESYISKVFRCSKCDFLESYAKERIYI